MAIQFVRHARAIAFVVSSLVASGCGLPHPTLDLPAPYEASGLRVSVDGFYTSGGSFVGLTGTAKNISGKDYSVAQVSLDIVDSAGVKVGDAFASTLGLKAGQEWRFQALFTTVFATSFKGIRPGRVTVMGTPENMAADMKANIAAMQAAASGNRLMGVFFEQRLPAGDFVPRITRLTSGGLADKSGWKVGDLILAVDDVDVRTGSDVVGATQRGGGTKTYTLQRGTEIIKSTVIFP